MIENPTKLRAAVIGAGKMGTFHANIYRQLPDIELVGLAVQNPANHQSKVQTYGVQVITTDELLEKYHPDLVSIATPTTDHCQTVLAALRADCHVLVEKPMATTIAEAKEMITAAEKAGKKLMVGHIELFNPVVTAAKKLLEENTLGTLKLVEGIRSGKLPPRVTTDVLLDLGFHDLYLFQFLLGELQIINGTRQRSAGLAHDDFISFSGRTDTGTLINYQTNWMELVPHREMRLVGDAGELDLNFVTKQLKLITLDHLSGQDIPINTGVNQLELEIREFISCIHNDTPPRISGEAGLQTLTTYLHIMEQLSEKTSIRANQ